MLKMTEESTKNLNLQDSNPSLQTGEIIVYNPNDSIKLNVWMENETVWLTIKQLALLFDRDRTVIGRHIKNIFTEGELQPSLVCAKFAHTGEYGRNAGYTQTKDVVFYNLDVIISVGYRVKSVRGTQFRQWANTVLKEYLIRGYAINPRIEQLERRVTKTEEKIDFFIKSSLPPVQGIFFDGQVYDAYEFICGLIKSAKSRIVLIDNYASGNRIAIRDAGIHAYGELRPQGLARFRLLAKCRESQKERRGTLIRVRPSFAAEDGPAGVGAVVLADEFERGHVFRRDDEVELGVRADVLGLGGLGQRHRSELEGVADAKLGDGHPIAGGHLRHLFALQRGPVGDGGVGLD